jgi:hypothetical protein
VKENLILIACLYAQAPRPKRKYTRRMDPAEVSAICRRNGSKLVEYEGKMVPAYEKGWRMQGEQRGVLCL